MTATPTDSVGTAPQFPVLDTLRAIGALAVLTTHTSFQAGDYTENGVWGTLMARLDVGVAIFFVLSGFLLSRPYVVRAFARREPPATGRYYWKRLVRVYPVYVVTVVVALLVVQDNTDVSLADWASTLLLLDVYTRDQLPHGLTQMWSLSAEVAFYLVLPLLMVLAVGRGRRAVDHWRFGAVLAGMSLLTVAWHIWLAGAVAEVSPGTPATWVFAYLTWFAMGMGLAYVHVAGQHGRLSRTTSTLSRLGAMPGVCWAAAFGLLLVAATPIAGPTLLFAPTTSESLVKNLLYTFVGGLLLVTGVYGRPGSRYVDVLSGRLLRHLGHISYSTFCIHLVVLYLVWEITGWQEFFGHGLPVWALTLAGSLLASELLYRFVEKPGMRLKDLGVRRGPPPAAPSSAAQSATTRY